MTSPELWVRLKPLLEAALEVEPGDRSTYLDDVCRGNSALREEAGRVLDACRRAGVSLEFLESPAVELAAPLLDLEAESLASSDNRVAGLAIGPYVLEKYLGAGGMGVVYAARDPRLDRKVALKLLPSWLPVGDEANRRLTDEARAASRLDHPNIQTVYEIGRTPDERPFIAMAYYDGETLKDLVARGPPEMRFALDLALQMAAGLGAAHDHGIVHRDVKPGNVIVTPDGVAKILDFGAAKIVTGRALIQGTETPFGTVAYMSPEQTRGDEVDARTDVWSLGVVLYEMLTGYRPFGGDSAQAMVQGIRHEEPEPLLRLRPDASEAVAAVVERCLQKDPKDRFRNASAVAEALRRAEHLSRASDPSLRRLPVAAGLIATVLLGAAVFWPERRPAPAVEAASALAPTSMRRLAVLPVAYPTGEPEDEYLVAGLTEELIAGFSRLSALRVIALSSVMPYQGTNLGVAQIASELNTDALLRSSVRETGDEIHLSLQLMEAPTGLSLWSDEYTTSVLGLPSVVRAVIEEVAAVLGIENAVSDGRLAERSGTESDEALDLYYRGRHFLSKLATPGATQQAREYFEQALDRDPAFALAWSGLSGSYHQQAIQGTLPTRDAEPRAREAAERALAIDPDLAEAHTHLGATRSWYDWDAEDAERHFRRALELDPSSARTHRFFAVHLRNQGRFEEALAMVRAGGELDPLSPGAYEQEGEILYFARRYDESLAKLQQLLAVDPTYIGAYFFIALIDIQMGRYEEALAALERTNPNTNAAAVRGQVLARLGRRDDAHRELARLDSMPRTGAVLFNQAGIHVALGELDTAMDLLEQAVERRPWQAQLLRVEPAFDPLRPNPRFQRLLETLGLTG